MKRFLLMAAAITLSLSARAADFGGIKTVYLLPMSNGLDQYLAVRLTTGVVLQVVTDPQKADAIFTDHLGESFEKSLDDLYGAKPTDSEGKTDDGSALPAQTFTRIQSGTRSRGAAFLVNRKTRDVVWSIYERPKSTSPQDLNRTADRIASNLAKSIKDK